METGWLCTGGTTTTPDTCNDKCGDGFVYKRSTPQYCDDQNVVDGDGCNQNCAVEAGYTCTGGDNTQKDVCKEICGDGKITVPGANA